MVNKPCCVSFRCTAKWICHTYKCMCAQSRPTLCIPWTVPQAPLSMGFSRQEYCSGWPHPYPRDLPDPGIEHKSPASPTLQADSLPISDHLTYLLRYYRQVKKQQLEPDVEQPTGSKLGKEYVKAIYFHPAYLTYMQRTSCEMLGWMWSTSWNQDCWEKYQ